MPRRERDLASDAVAELEALLDAGDIRSAARCARRVLAGAGTAERDRERARAALERTRPDLGAAIVTGVGLAWFVLVAAFGLIVRS